MQYPSLAAFPRINGSVRPIVLSDTMANALAASALLNYGTDGHVRCSHVGPLPIIKMCHPNKTSRLRIQHEFEMLKEMGHRALSVPLFGNEPMVDDEGIFGYRMELLTPIDFSALGAVSNDLKAIVDRMHDCGLSHGDLNPSNIMRTSSGSLVMIDPSSSGLLGEEIPDYIMSQQYESGVFCTTADEKYLKMFFGRTAARF